MLGKNGVGGGGAIDFASLLNNARITPDYSASLNAAAAGGGASGIDYSSILGGAAGGGNVDIAAFLAAQNKLGGLAGVIGNLGGLGDKLESFCVRIFSPALAQLAETMTLSRRLDRRSLKEGAIGNDAKPASPLARAAMRS